MRFALAILAFKSVLSLPSSVIIVPKYLNCSVLLISIPYIKRGPLSGGGFSGINRFGASLWCWDAVIGFGGPSHFNHAVVFSSWISTCICYICGPSYSWLFFRIHGFGMFHLFSHLTQYSSSNTGLVCVLIVFLFTSTMISVLCTFCQCRFIVCFQVVANLHCWCGQDALMTPFGITSGGHGRTRVSSLSKNSHSISSLALSIPFSCHFCPSSESHNKNLHASTKTKNQMKSWFFLDIVIIIQCSSIFQLFTKKLIIVIWWNFTNIQNLTVVNKL